MTHPNVKFLKIYDDIVHVLKYKKKQKKNKQLSSRQIVHVYNLHAGI